MIHLTPHCTSGNPVQMQTAHATAGNTKNSTLKYTAVAIAVLAITGCSKFSLPGNSSLGDFEDDVIVEGERSIKKCTQALASEPAI